MQIGASHLTYCSNIHPGEDWVSHFSEIDTHFPKIKQQLSPEKPMALGLRLANAASLELIEESHLRAFKSWLAANDAYVFTMNGFPYGGFHHTVVKDQVHTPDWTTNARRDYTKRLADILSQLLPEGMDGGISTSPLSYRHWFQKAELPSITQQATAHIIEVAQHLIHLQKQRGQIIHLDLEPEPDGILETGEEFIQWYEEVLLPQALPIIQQSEQTDEATAAQLVKNHIRLCYDVCHFAIGYEPHETILDQLQEKGIQIGKFQISAALKAAMPAPDQRAEIVEGFAGYNESTYLHQVVAKTFGGQLLRYRDLPEALADAQNTDVIEWRAHFHVPIFTDQYGVLQSTQSAIEEVLRLHLERQLTHHLEVETYTWEVLPDLHKLPIEQSIARELAWVRQQLLIP